AGSRAYAITVGIPCTETAAPTGLSLTIDTSKRFNMPYTLDWTPLSGYSGDYVLETTSDDPWVGTTSALVTGHSYRGALFHAPPPTGRYPYYVTVRTTCTLSRTSDPVTLVLTGSPATSLRALRDLTQIAIWEQTDVTSLQPHTFGRDDRELHDVFLDRMVGGP